MILKYNFNNTVLANKYLKPFKKRDNKGIYFEFGNEGILLEHLKKIDEKYYKYIFEEGEE